MIKSLEGVRGVAALIVALYHLGIGTEYFSVVRNGYLFVDLFFVLSGFVICSAYSSRMDSGHDFKAFVIRRFGRLFPLLVFSTLFFVVIVNAIALAKHIAIGYGLSGVLNRPDVVTDYLVPSATELLGTLTMVHGLGVFDRLILNTPSWSISTEFFTYLLFAATALLVRPTRRLIAFSILAVVGLLVSVWASVTVYDCLRQGDCLSLTYDFGFARCVFDFFLGTLTYWAGRSIRINDQLLQLAGLIGVAIPLAMVDALPAAAFAFPFAFALLILSLSRDSGLLADVLNTAPFQMLGQRSYSIYMMHMPLLMLFDNFAKRADGLIASAAVLVTYVVTLCVVAGWTYRLIEDPFRARFNRLASTTSRSLPSADTALELQTPARLDELR